ncbi:hypothetical protein AMELA_G00011650 [Ameiurus melas]|uniref:fructose-2,6-bisphosphate 2-phosphatase n=1 Tax=Ameiurus melas TaxID=219545 RepID=A0A7J6BKU7_AMEME|nr:hypothetical protein AMELA_G00011650 [Ameiurus melas]
MLSFGLTIIRHGETQHNKDGLLQGQGIDSPLSEIGMQQAEAASRYLQDVHFTNVFASDMKRAMQTAEIIVRKNKTCSNLDIVTAPSLKERSFGDAEGGQVEDMKNMAKAAGQPIPEYTPPNGETMDQVKVRISTFLKSLFQQMADEHQDKMCQDYLQFKLQCGNDKFWFTVYRRKSSTTAPDKMNLCQQALHPPLNGKKPCTPYFVLYLY